MICNKKQISYIYFKIKSSKVRINYSLIKAYSKYQKKFVNMNDIDFSTDKEGKKDDMIVLLDNISFQILLPQRCPSISEANDSSWKNDLQKKYMKFSSQYIKSFTPESLFGIISYAENHFYSVKLFRYMFCF